MHVHVRPSQELKCSLENIFAKKRKKVTTKALRTLSFAKKYFVPEPYPFSKWRRCPQDGYGEVRGGGSVAEVFWIIFAT